ncbi:MAG: PBP1A family penicillin-binding protein [Clostridia bacterium]|nr:PBP1A family penicillin-binding protein [Clostridia bacterium]
MKNNPYSKIFLKVFGITAACGLALAFIVFLGAVLGFFGNMQSLDIDSIISNSSSQVVYIDSKGNERPLTTLSAEQNRIWVDFDDIPQDMKDAFVSIEDERFYSHSGFDMRRTFKAFLVFVKNKLTGGETTFGGSTITQQLVKNLTQKTERTAARKIQEISRSVNLEKRLSKDKILELYLNSIYLSQGCNGVQAASHKFFGKPVSELSLAECASIAGITQYPTLYDPLINPENNKKKQEIVLSKMLELGYITKEEHDEAMGEELVFAEFDESALVTGTIHSYFVDQIAYDVLEGLQELGYTESIAKKMLYSGGLKIVSTIDPSVQKAMEKVFENTDNFPNSTGNDPAQSAMVVMDPYTGQVKGMVGGVGKKSGNLVLNRATQTLRQPGSSIKPIAVYAPAIERGIINAADIYDDKAISYGDWTPRNYDHTYSGKVSIRTAVRKSLNTIPVQVLDEMGANASYNFLSQKLGVSSLVKNRAGSDGKVYSDIGLSQLALGGLTDGISVIEMTAAYTPFVNRGIFTKPYCFTSVVDSKGNELLSNKPKQTIALSEQTAYVMSRLLSEVVSYGTGGGAQLASGMYTAGKTGTTSDSHDRWFVGYTPHYVGAVWYGYDIPRPMTHSGNPCIRAWKMVMDEINSGKSKISPAVPKGVKSVSYCAETGLLSGEHCGENVTSFWFTEGNAPKETCKSKHLPEGEEENPDSETGENTENTENPDSATTENGGEVVPTPEVVEEVIVPAA